MPDPSFRLLVVGVGGQGVLTAARLVGEAAMAAGLSVSVGQIHGMSQRGGSVESTVVMAPAPGSTNPYVGAGEADAVLALEPLEALRARARMSPRTRAVVNREPIVPFLATFEGVGVPSVDGILASLRAVCADVAPFDGEAVARTIGSRRALNVAMLGALASFVRLPFSESLLWDAIAAHPSADRRAFELGKELTS